MRFSCGERRYMPIACASSSWGSGDVELGRLTEVPERCRLRSGLWTRSVERFADRGEGSGVGDETLLPRGGGVGVGVVPGGGVEIGATMGDGFGVR